MMLCRFAFAAFVLSLTTLPATISYAEDTSKQTIEWKKVGNWDVMVDATYGYHCFIATSFEGGTLLRIGFTPEGEKAPVYVAVGNMDWKSIEDGKDYDVVVQLDKQPPWKGTASGRRLGTLPILNIPTDDPKFITEFVRKLSIKIWYNEKIIANLNLSGSAAAANELGVCETQVQQYLSNSAPKSKDPFSDGNPAARDASDPFKL